MFVLQYVKVLSPPSCPSVDELMISSGGKQCSALADPGNDHDDDGDSEEDNNDDVDNWESGICKLGSVELAGPERGWKPMRSVKLSSMYLLTGALTL